MAVLMVLADPVHGNPLVLDQEYTLIRGTVSGASYGNQVFLEPTAPPALATSAIRCGNSGRQSSISAGSATTKVRIEELLFLWASPPAPGRQQRMSSSCFSGRPHRWCAA